MICSTMKATTDFYRLREKIPEYFKLNRNIIKCQYKFTGCQKFIKALVLNYVLLRQPFQAKLYSLIAAKKTQNSLFQWDASEKNFACRI